MFVKYDGKNHNVLDVEKKALVSAGTECEDNCSLSMMYLFRFLYFINGCLVLLSSFTAY